MEQRRINGGGPAVLLVHATGMCKETWRPVLAESAPMGIGFDAILLDQRGHGASSSFSHPLDWWHVGEDVLRVAGTTRELVGVGHSSGGTAILHAELLAPGTFRSLVLIEPIVAPPPYRRNDEEPLAIASRRRTGRFPDIEAAAARLRGRGAFAGWDERAFTGYLAGGLEVDPDAGGGAVRLACRPEDEAEYFSTLSATPIWGRLGEVNCPVELIAGEDSESHDPRYLGRLNSRIPHATVTRVPGANHFVPMQRPDVVAAALAAAVAGAFQS